jgi:uridine kinase
MEESDTSKAFIRTPVVIITGATSAGKTSVSNLLKETSNNPHYLVISQDDYFKDVHEVPFNPNGHQMWDGKLIACINS